jgi:7,8-dihydro-6-hydroxymethylpterin dimethyltransferase
MKTIRNTTSICPECFKEIDATLTEDDSGIWLEKNCSLHGSFRFLVENNKEIFYLIEPQESRSDLYCHTLTVPITYNCNLNCEYCFISSKEKEDLPSAELKKIIADFKGYYIGLSGGEPTLNKELPEYIRYINSINKCPVIITNGIKLSSENFLHKLTEAGKFTVFFSLDSLQNSFYEKLKGPGRILELKEKALSNIKKNNIYICISSSIYKSVNDNEIGDLFRYCAKNNFPEIRIRSIQSLGRNPGKFDSYFISDLIDLFCKQTTYKIKTVLEGSLPPYHKQFYFQQSINRRFFFIKFFHFIFPLNIIEPKLPKILKFIFWGFYRLKIVRYLVIRFIHWPTAETIYADGMANKGVAHVYDMKEYNFCYALVLKDKI